VANNPNVLKPLKARGVFKPTVITETGPYPYKGNGVYTFFDQTELPNRDEGEGSLITYIVSNVNGVNRAFYFKRHTYSGISGGETGSTYNFLNLDYDAASFVNFEKSNNYTYLTNVTESGLVSVTAHDGNYVTLQLTDVNLEPLDEPSANTPASVKVNGTITYKLSDTGIINLNSTGEANKAGGLPTALKKSPNG